MLTLEAQIKRFQLTARNHARLMREINRKTMERHKTQRLPNHFEEVAYTKYGARPRSAKYNEQKRRSKFIGHVRPNVKSGRLRRGVLSRVKITATQHGARLIARGTVNSRLQNWQKREIAVIAPDEIKAERRKQAFHYKQGATSRKYARKRRRKVG